MISVILEDYDVVASEVVVGAQNSRWFMTLTNCWSYELLRRLIT
jgi:hypothetical protein